MNETEEWRAIEGWPYEVSSLGRVRRTIPGRGGRRVEFLHPWFRGKGNNAYLSVPLIADGRKKNFLVHRLVCAAFHGPQPSPYHIAAHNNDVKTDNRPENLRWATHKENGEDKVKHGRSTFGSRSARAKLTDDQVRSIRADQRPMAVLSREYGVSSPTISDIKKGIRYHRVA